MPKIISFQGGFSNDKNSGQEGSFWNISGLEYRKNIAYIELAKGVTDIYTLDASDGTPTVLTLWGNYGMAGRDIMAITNNGKVFNYVTGKNLLGTLPNSNVGCNAFEVGNNRYIVGNDRIFKLSPSETFNITNTYNFVKSTTTRPVLNYFGDILIGNGDSIARFDEPYASIVEYTAGVTNGCIGGLDGTIVALTQIGTNIYVWCNNGSNTNLYIWDGESSHPSQSIKYADMPVQNVALLGNMHYWWTKKSSYSIRTVNIGESYQPQTFIKTAYPLYTLNSNTGSDENRMIIDTINQSEINAIETLSDNVFLPGIGCIYSFGKYYPGGQISLGREITFTGTNVSAMVSGGYTWNTSRDFGGMLGFAYNNGSGYTVAVYNAGQNGENPGVFYRSSGFYESMQWIAPDMYKGENDIKITLPCFIPHSSCTIKVYEKRDEGSYNLIKMIGIADINNGNGGFDVIEIPIQGKWRTKQLKFELITTNSSYSPRLYIGIDNQTQPVGNMMRK